MVRLVCAVCDVGVCGCVGVWGRIGGEAKAILGDGGIGTAGEGGGPRDTRCVGVSNMSAGFGCFHAVGKLAASLSHVLCDSA